MNGKQSYISNVVEGLIIILLLLYPTVLSIITLLSFYLSIGIDEWINLMTHLAIGTVVFIAAISLCVAVIIPKSPIIVDEVKHL